MKTLKKPSGQTWARFAYDFRERAEKAEAAVEHLTKERDEWKRAAESQNRQWATKCTEATELCAEVADLKARLKAARHGYRNPYITVQWKAGYRATDLRVKNWRKP